jgi:hypothetical protein
MHAQDDGIQVGVDTGRLPTHYGRQQTFLLQVCPGWFEDLIVAAGHHISFSLEGDGQLVHDTAPNGDKMYVHSAVNVFNPNLLAKNFPFAGRGLAQMEYFILLCTCSLTFRTLYPSKQASPNLLLPQTDFPELRRCPYPFL